MGDEVLVHEAADEDVASAVAVPVGGPAALWALERLAPAKVLVDVATLATRFTGGVLADLNNVRAILLRLRLEARAER